MAINIKPIVERIEKLGFVKPPEPQRRTNPFTQKFHLLQPEAVQLYDFITTQRYICGKDYTRSDWDNARYYFAGMWENEYYDLLD